MTAVGGALVVAGTAGAVAGWLRRRKEELI
jgi:hypothetical protein